MATNSVNSISNLMRISGLGGSGLDTDSIVKQLMKSERAPLDKLSQKKQLAQWRQDDYRSITNLLRGLKDAYFNVAKSSSNIMSQSSFKKYVGTTSDSSYVTVSGSAGSTTGSHTISVISLATAGKAVSGGASGVTDKLEGTVSNYALSGKTLQLTVDGVTRDITLDNYTYTASPASSDIVSKAGTGLQSLLDQAFGTVLVAGVPTSKVTASFDAATQKLTFDTAGGASKVTLSGGTALSDLGFTAGASNRLDINQSLDSLKTRFANDLTFNADGKLIFNINGSTFTFDKSVSLSSMMNTINADTKANVNMKYDETTDRFTITAKQLGYGDNIKIDAATQQGNFFGAGSASAIGTGSATTKQGSDAIAMIDNQLVTRNSNSFTVNGVTYNLLKAHADPDTQSVNVSLSLNVDGVYDTIKGFVDKYNEVISTINTKLGEKLERDFQPLTDEQKVGMSDDDIKKWDEKAKAGLLKNDPILQNIVYSMRRALSNGVEGVTTNLSAIGITTGKYQDQGKLIINEDKLKAAIQSDPESVNDLFTKQSTTSYRDANTPELREKRNKEEGFANRLADIIEDNIRTIGGKGKLLEKAGIQGDSTEYTNTIYKEIDRYDIDMESLADKLADKENAYYARFTAMEKYIQQMSNQSSWLSSQFSSSGG